MKAVRNTTINSSCTAEIRNHDPDCSKRWGGEQEEESQYHPNLLQKTAIKLLSYMLFIFSRGKQDDKISSMSSNLRFPFRLLNVFLSFYYFP